MHDLSHTPRRTRKGEAILYGSAPAPQQNAGDPDPPSFYVCKECGCFYARTDGAVCGNKVVKMLREKVL